MIEFLAGKNLFNETPASSSFIRTLHIMVTNQILIQIMKDDSLGILKDMVNGRVGDVYMKVAQACLLLDEERPLIGWVAELMVSHNPSLGSANG